MRVAEIDVIPMIMFWGQHVTPGAKPVRKEGDVRIVAGTQADLWRRAWPHSILSLRSCRHCRRSCTPGSSSTREKSIGAAVERRLPKARQLGLVSMAITGVLIALFLITQVWAGLDRVLGAVFRFGGGAVGAACSQAPHIWARRAGFRAPCSPTGTDNLVPARLLPRCSGARAA
jgi:hypothetical protein